MFGRRHPLEKVHAKMNDLVVAWKALLAQSGVGRGKRQPVTGPLAGSNFRFENLKHAVRSEVVAWSACGETSDPKTKTIVSSIAAFQAEKGRLHDHLATQDPKVAKNVLKDVKAATNHLASAIKELEDSVASRGIRVVRLHTACPKQFLRIRKVMAGINPKAAQQLIGTEVDSWCMWPGLRPDDDISRVNAVAKLILVNWQENQCYELRCPSSVSGRYMKFLHRFWEFPTVDDLHDCTQRYERPEKIYVAATKPTWRTVWVFDREEEGW